jgi:hypothetical protein
LIEYVEYYHQNNLYVRFMYVSPLPSIHKISS